VKRKLFERLKSEEFREEKSDEKVRNKNEKQN
jgi:hypothetical protein